MRDQLLRAENELRKMGWSEREIAAVYDGYPFAEDALAFFEKCIADRIGVV